MKVAEIVRADGSQLVRLPGDFTWKGTPSRFGARARPLSWNRSSRRRGRRGSSIAFASTILRSGSVRGQVPPAPNWIERPHALPARYEYVHRRDAPSWAGASTPGFGAPADSAISSITTYELYTGIEKCAIPVKESAKVNLLLSTVSELVFDGQAARKPGVFAPFSI